MKLLVCLCSVATLCVGSVSGEELYHLTFDAPIHTVGSPATTGISPAPNPRPSSLEFGTSLVVPTFAGATNPALKLVTAGIGGGFDYSQYRFDLSPYTAYPQYRLDADLILSNFQTDGTPFKTDNTKDYLSIIFDTPSVVRLDFTDLGLVLQNEVNIGTYQFGQVMHISALVDLPLNQWTIFKNGTQLFSGQFFYPYPASPNPPTNITSVRINLADSVTFAGSPVAVIDNFVIQGIPEPSVAALAILSIGAFGLRRCRKSCQVTT